MMPIFDDLVLANSNDVLHDVVHDSNIHDEVAHDATLPLVVLSNDDSTLLVGCPQDTPSKVVQRCCRQLDVEEHSDECSMLTLSPLDLHS